LAAVDLQTGEVHPLGVEGTGPRYLPTGHLVFAGLDGQLRAVSFDVDALEAVGTPTAMPERVQVKPGELAANFDVSLGGALVYAPSEGVAEPGVRILRVARDGTSAPIAEMAGDLGYPRVSPDASRLALAVGTDLWVLDLARGVPVPNRVTFSGIARFLPIWTRDGERLTHSDDVAPRTRILLTAADGSGQQDTLLPVGPRAFPTSWSPDGGTLLYTVGPDGTSTMSRDLRAVIRRGGAAESVPVIETAFSERGAVFSPDGAWIAYVSDKAAGRDEVYLRPFMAPGAEQAVSVGGGREPVWARSGDEIFYRGPTDFFAVSVERDAPSLRIGQPQALFRDRFRRDLSTAAGSYANYDVLSNGDFVVIADPEALAKPTPTIVLNWTQQLRARLPN
jgi:hypothetical protein